MGVYVKVVRVDETAKMESILNHYRVGLNNWDKTKVFNYNGVKIINYVIMCDADTYEAIKFAMKQ